MHPKTVSLVVKFGNRLDWATYAFAVATSTLSCTRSNTICHSKIQCLRRMFPSDSAPKCMCFITCPFWYGTSFIHVKQLTSPLAKVCVIFFLHQYYTQSYVPSRIFRLLNAWYTGTCFHRPTPGLGGPCPRLGRIHSTQRTQVRAFSAAHIQYSVFVFSIQYSCSCSCSVFTTQARALPAAQIQ